MLHGRDGAEDGEAVDAGLDVGRGAVLVGQHLGDAGDLVARRDDQRDHGRAIAAGLLQALDQLLHLPDLHVLVRGRLVGAGAAHPGLRAGRRRRGDDTSQQITLPHSSLARAPFLADHAGKAEGEKTATNQM